MRVLPANPNKKPEKRKTGLLLVTAAVLVVCGILLHGKKELIADRNAKQIQYSELQLKYETELERSSLLSEKRAYMQTIRYIEEVARERLGLVYEDEVIFRPEDEE